MVQVYKTIKKTDKTMNYQVLYGNGKSISPSGLLLDACEIADVLSSSGVSKNRVFDYIYQHPRRYSVVGNTNYIWLDIEEVGPLIAEMRTAIKDSSLRPKYDQSTEHLRDLCNELEGYKRMTYQSIAGTLNTVKL